MSNPHHFFVRLSGRVHTAVTEESPDPVGLKDANVTASLLLGSVAEANDTAQTNELGEYTLLLAAPRNFSKAEMTRLVLKASVSDVDGSGIVHDYRFAGSQKEFRADGLASKTAHHFRDTNFHDPFHIVLSGRISSEPMADEWRAFRGCGVEGVVVRVFRDSDVTRDAKTILFVPILGADPIRTSLPTLTDGKWQVAAPKSTPVVAIPGALPGAIAHAFLGPAVANSSSYRHDGRDSHSVHARRTELNFFDVTTRTVKLRIFGGIECQYDVGTAMPTFVHEGCGGRKITMDKRIQKPKRTRRFVDSVPRRAARAAGGQGLGSHLSRALPAAHRQAAHCRTDHRLPPDDARVDGRAEDCSCGPAQSVVRWI